MCSPTAVQIRLPIPTLTLKRPIIGACLSQNNQTSIPLNQTSTKSQSVNLLRAVESKLGGSATITHAAVVLAFIRARPMPPSYEPQAILTPCIMNGRGYLLSSSSPEKTYAPICRDTGEVSFPNLQDYALSASTPRLELLMAFKHPQTQNGATTYQKQRINSFGVGSADGVLGR